VTHRIEVAATVEDTRAAVVAARLRAHGVALNGVWIVDAYSIEKPLTDEQLRRVGAMLANPVTQRFSVDSPAVTDGFDAAIEIGFLPGVTDNVAHTARESIEDLLGVRFGEGEGVASARLHLIAGIDEPSALAAIAELLSNGLIQQATVKSRDRYLAEGGMAARVPMVHLAGSGAVTLVDLDVPDEELIAIGKLGVANPDGTRRGPLSLDLAAMKVIQRHFQSLGRAATDVEIEALAQTWSEHCKHTIFANPIDEIDEGLYRAYIKRATQEVRKAKGERDFCVSVFTDNAGAIAFDDDFLITHKVETHNSPSALDPFGGAITGIVGVNRDALGFGLRAKPVANVYGFCFGDPNDETTLYRDAARTQPMLSPRRILEGVVEGVNAGGNQSGIPTPQGFVHFDERYKGKPLVFVGTVGLIPRRIEGRDGAAKGARPGDLIVMAGGRVGKDGIHGATFSSEALASGSPATAVQIGDPITQKKLSDALVKEARQLGLYTSITDNGAGGLSSSVAEMARECGGCHVELDEVPLKYPGLAPWEIWISESQERMTLAVPPEKWETLRELLARRGVEAAAIGVFTETAECLVTYHGEPVLRLDMAFLHDGLPKQRQVTKRPERAKPTRRRAEPADLGQALLAMIARPNLASFAFISAQFDHEVQGNSVLKPLQGRGRVNANTSVIRPRLDSFAGVALSQALFPSYSELDPHAMALACIDAAIRQVVAAGADPERIALLDNFCWCSSADPERLWQLKEAARGCYEAAVAFGAPFISGKDSMFNDFRGFGAAGKPVAISIPPTLLISALGLIDDAANAVSLDFKRPGDLLYLLGETREELGGSEWLAMLGGDPACGEVPAVNLATNRARYVALSQAIQAGVVASAQSLGRGGLGAALAMSAVGGMLGATVALDAATPGCSAEVALFSESAGRVLVSVAPSDRAAFEAIFAGQACARIGKVREDGRVEIAGADIATEVDSLAAAYRATFAGY
jgi:phosphoribosylformylglycinamidine synthase